ncbi:MAG: DpnD/PcfM family protein [Clostridiales bacterium]|nr:DpnD/PcfM family protein [Clostridiales bacterium]
MKYIVTIEEIISQNFEVQANAMKTALEIAAQKYKNGNFVLEPGNLVCKQICAKSLDGTENVDWCEF